MKTESSKKVQVKIASQDSYDNIPSARKTIKILQTASTNKENFVTTKATTFKEAKLASEQEKLDAKRKNLKHKSVQTFEDYTVTVDDLTTEEPSENYWRLLAEKRGEILNNSLSENEKLKENITVLQEENKICKEMLNESRNLVEVLQEMLNESNPDEAEEANDSDSD